MKSSRVYLTQNGNYGIVVLTNRKDAILSAIFARSFCSPSYLICRPSGVYKYPMPLRVHVYRSNYTKRAEQRQMYVPYPHPSCGYLVFSCPPRGLQNV